MKRLLGPMLVLAFVGAIEAQEPFREDCGPQLVTTPTAWGAFKSIVRGFFRFEVGGAGAGPTLAPSYMASNLERPKVNDEPTRIEVSFNAPGAVYFRRNTYESLDAGNSYFFNEPNSAVALPRVDEIDRTKPFLEVRGGEFLQGQLVVPEGFVAVAVKGARAERSSYGVTFQGFGEPFFVQLAERDEVRLDAEARRTYTVVHKKPGLTEYPREIQFTIGRLKRLRASGEVSDGDVIDQLTAFLQGYFRYVHDGEGTHGVLGFCRLRHTQCAGAAAVLITLLRGEFQIPCFAVSGFVSARWSGDESVSVITNKMSGHMWVRAWDSERKEFRSVDPTPPGESEEERLRDPAFEDWPRGNSAPSRDAGRTVRALRSLSSSHEYFLRPYGGGYPDEVLPLKSFRERRREEMDAHWKKVFDAASGLDWAKSVEAFRSSFATNAEASAAAHVLGLVAHLPARTLAAHVATLDHTPQTNAEAHRFWYTISMLKSLAPFGASHSTRSGPWARLETALARFDGLADEPGDRITETRRTMPGPLSRRHFDENHLKPFLQMREMHDRISLARIETYRAAPPPRSVVSMVPTESDPSLDVAEDFDAFAYFERDGLPHRYDAIRVVNGDMMRRVWSEDRPRPDPPPMRGHAEDGGLQVTVILYDRSSSMEGLEELFRDRLIQTWIDELSHQKVVLLGFTDEPDPKELVLDTDAQRDRQFRRMLGDEAFFESTGSTDILKAFARAIEIVDRLGDDYTGVNLRIITDGGAPLKLADLRQAKARLGAHVAINVTGVTLAAGSATLRDFLTEGAREGLLGEQLHVHFDLSEIQEILAVRQGLEAWFEGAELPKRFRELRQVPEETWVDFREIAREMTH